MTTIAITDRREPIRERLPAAVVAEQRPWVAPMHDAAFQGVAGEFVRLFLPETEADPAALLLTFLVGAGSMIGRGPRYQVRSTRHGVNLFSVVVGETSKARKGTATDLTVEVLSRVDRDFMSTRVRSGLSSGEGLIESVRDAREEDVAVKGRDGSLLRFERQQIHTGEPDKRLLVIESEFSTVLQQCGRDGNILSAVLRDCWDGKALRVLARSNKDSCLEPHVSLIGNVTAEELQRLLTTTDRANGFGNRILWCCARRSKLLAGGGGEVAPERYEGLLRRLRSAVATARETAQVTFDAETFRAWESVYAELAVGATGMFGALTARGEAQVVRLSTLYALLDGSAFIRREHLAAAQAVWGYCEESVRCIFGDVLGDETADAILKALKGSPAGLTQTEINRSFHSHKPSTEVARAFTMLQAKGLVSAEKLVTGGGPATRWRLLL